jgi:phosphoglycolate phosphatase
MTQRPMDDSIHRAFYFRYNGKMNESKLSTAKLVVFDLDGTLVDSKRDIADALNATFALVGLPPLDDATVSFYVGNGVGPLIERAVAHVGGDDKRDEVFALFRGEYDRRLLVHTRPFPGVMATLEKLSKTHKLALLTNKAERFTLPILDGLGLTRYFDGAIVGGDTLPTLKPDPAVFHLLASRHGIDPKDSVMVGDSSVDITTGKNVGAATVGVTYGFRSVQELTDAGVDVLIDAMEEIVPLLNGGGAL